MMNAKAIMDYLTAVANNSLLMNILMHVLVLSVIVTLFLSKNDRFRRISFYAVISILFLLVMINSFSFGNLFNAVIFAILTIAFLAEFLTGKNDIQIIQNRLGVIVSLLFVLIGMWYPEFVKANIISLFRRNSLSDYTYSFRFNNYGFAECRQSAVFYFTCGRANVWYYRCICLKGFPRCMSIIIGGIQCLQIHN